MFIALLRMQENFPECCALVCVCGGGVCGHMYVPMWTEDNFSCLSSDIISLVYGCVWGGLGDLALLEGSLSLQAGLESLKSPAISSVFSPLPVVIQDVSPQRFSF